MTIATRLRTTCPYCGVGCGIIATPPGTITGDPTHPANFGRLCSKGAALAETLADGPDRLLRPRIRGRDASWGEALDLVAARFEETVARHGPDSVAFYVSGQFLTEDYYVANKLMKGFIGSANIDTNSRLCMASSVAGHVRAFGEDVVPGCYEDLELADLVVLVGSNAAWCHPVLFQRLAAAKQARGTRIVVVDPRRTATCETADLHLPLRAGTDVALFAGLLVHLADHGRIAREWVARHTSGLGEALATARETAGSPARVAAITGLAEADIAAFYAMFAATGRTVTIYSQGVNQSSSGTDKVNAIVNSHLATARIGRPGMGPFSVTGQPNAMGGREVGGMANQLAAHMGFTDADDIDRVRRFWHAPRIASHPGLKAVELFDAVAAGRIKAIWIMATNPAASMPRGGAVQAALEHCPFVVVSDCWDSGDTARLAHVLLPAAGWGEKNGTVTNSERRISRQRAFRTPPGEARPDWWMLAEVARRMGWGDAFAYRGPADIFREHAALSAFENEGGRRRAFDIGALATLTDAGYDAMEPVRWPFPSAAAVSRTAARANSAAEIRGRLFADGGFFTPDRRARFVATAWRPPAVVPDDAYPLVLNTGRVRDQWHTMSRTGRVPRLMAHVDAPFLALYPDDATWFGLADGDLARVESRFGDAILPVRVSAEQRPGSVFAPMHWNDAFSSAGPIGRLVGDAVDPVSGQPELKATPVRVAPVDAQWHGLLLRGRRRGNGDSDGGGSGGAGWSPGRGFYWARMPVDGGEAFALAGWDDLPEPGAALDGWAAALLGAPPDGERLEYADRRRGSFRYASIAKGQVEAILFVARHGGGLPSRGTLAAFLNEDAASSQTRAGVLAGRPRGSAPEPSDGPVVCSCFSVGLHALTRAIAAGDVASVAEIGAAMQAGTNCGSCVPELAKILRDALAPAGGRMASAAAEGRAAG